jgi:hypothetical protein
MKRISVLIALSLLAAAPAAGGHGSKANTFSGSCHFEGVVQFTPPLTNSERPTRGFARAAGPCEGTFTDRRGGTHTLDGDRMTYVASNRGSMSCALGQGATGDGYLGYRGRKLRFELTENRVGAVAQLTLRGRKGGGGNGTANVSQDEDPAEIAQKCMGSGLEQVRIEGNLETPGISG